MGEVNLEFTFVLGAQGDSDQKRQAPGSWGLISHARGGQRKEGRGIVRGT